MKILFYGESPVVSTGLAQVSRTILDAIKKNGHEVEIVGTNHHLVTSYEKDVFPYDIVPVLKEDADDANVTKTAIDRIKNSNYDLFFCSTDFGRDIPIFQALIEEKQKRDFLIVGYYAVDCDIIPPSTFDTLSWCNAKIVYSNHAKRVIESLRPEYQGLVNVMYLACEPDVFYPLSAEERRKARKDIFNIEDDDTFLAISVNRNQCRKDLGRLMAIFHEFHIKHTNSMLYMHAQQVDTGGSLFGIAQSLGMGSTIDDPETIFTGPNYHIAKGYTREYLNRVYNAADVLLSTSTGEGWGLSTTEALSAELPVIVPRNTAFVEIVGEEQERGFLVKSGGDIDHRIFLYGLTCNPRDIVHAQDMIDTLEYVYTHREDAKARAKKGREWTMQYANDKQIDRWCKFFNDLQLYIYKLTKEVAK